MKKFFKVFSLAILSPAFLFPPFIGEAKASTLSNNIHEQSVETNINLTGNHTEQLLIAQRPIVRRRYSNRRYLRRRYNTRRPFIYRRHSRRPVFYRTYVRPGRRHYLHR